MKRLVLAALALAAAALAWSAIPPEKPLLVTNHGAKPPVAFDHTKHSAVACAACHHKEGEGKYKCGECHAAEEKAGVPALREAAHGKEKGACYACHLKPDAVRKKKCGECHAG